MTGNGALRMLLAMSRMAVSRPPGVSSRMIMPSAPAVFARRLGCPILPMTVVRKAGHHLIRILPPLELQKTDNPQADIEANTALCNRTIEAWVRENPGQWFTLLSRRFR